MGFGISVSVDSLVEQTVDTLLKRSYPIDDPIYRRLVTSASFPSEILLLDPPILSSLISSPGDNLTHILRTCVESFASSDRAFRINSAALLLRIFPFLCGPESPIPFEQYLLTQTDIAGVRHTSPGAFIVETSLNLLVSFDASDSVAFLDDVELHIPVFDLLALTVFCLAHYFQNRTLYHQMIVVAQANLNEFCHVLFNYVGLGGRRESLIGVLTLLLFHPSESFLEYQIAYVRAGGQLSQKLCAVTNENSDYLCLLCALAMLEDDATPSVWNREAPIVRLGLAKVLFNTTVELSPWQIVAAYKITASPLARVLMTRVTAPQDAQDKCPPLSCEIMPLHKYPAWIKKVADLVGQAYLYIKSYLFTDTGLTQAAPPFTEIDAIVAEMTP
jgi:hypothetical protein